MKKCLWTVAMLFAVTMVHAQRQKNSFDLVKPPVEPVPRPAAPKTADEPDFDLVRISDNGKSCAYVIGENSQSFTARRVVAPFAINRYETTYRLWYDIRVWAEAHGYYFQNPGQEGSSGRHGRIPSAENHYQPVTMINWYDSVVWCNALSERYGRTPCYWYNGEVLRDSSDTASCDLAQCRWDANGFRLPTEAEWELAARITVQGLQRGDLASGQIDKAGVSDPSVPADMVAWFSDNADETHTVGTAGTPFLPGAAPELGSGTPNGANIFDMSGNVMEWCWDWNADYTDVPDGIRATGPASGAERVCRGGSWSPYSLFIYAGDRYAFDPNEAYSYMGFRLCSSYAE